MGAHFVPAKLPFEPEAVVAVFDYNGGQACIVIDDHCYALYHSGPDAWAGPATHWFSEAVDALIGIVTAARS